MNYANIKPVDIANGLGIRVSLFVSGCNHHCKECFNPEAWDFAYGKPFDKSVEDEIIRLLTPDYVAGITFLGGEPMEPQNQQALLPFIRRLKEHFGAKKNIWCYTGFVYDKDLIPGGRAYTKDTGEILSNVDVLVDGPFVLNLKDISLNFRGSSNQRVIDLKKTIKSGKVELFLE